jgi:hypothetical protein
VVRASAGVVASIVTAWLVATASLPVAALVFGLVAAVLVALGERPRRHAITA